MAPHGRVVAGLCQGPASSPCPFVTRTILESMVPYPDVAALLDAARRREIRPIRPRIVRVGGEERVLLPGDPGYF